MSGLAIYASVAYRRLRFREQALREATAVAQERARASDEALQARDEFLSVASHELRTPLTALKLQTERALRKPPDPALASGAGARGAGGHPPAGRAAVEPGGHPAGRHACWRTPAPPCTDPTWT